MSANLLKLFFWSVSIISYSIFADAATLSKDSSIQFQYNTAQAKTKAAVCKGPCGRFGKNYDWCNVTDTEWDFCSSETKTNIVSKDFSVTQGPCKGPCYHKDPELIDDLWCEVYWGIEDKCIEEKHRYVQAMTVYGLECVGSCKKHDNKQYFWCYDTTRTKSYCALPARVISG